MPVITLCRLLFKHPPSTNVKLGLSPIENCQRKRSYDGGLGCWSLGGGSWCVCARKGRGGW